MSSLSEDGRGSRTEAEHFPTCQTCGRLAESVYQRRGADKKAYMCDFCLTLFWFADVLLEADVTEAEIVPTLAFASVARGLRTIFDMERCAQEVRSLVAKHTAFELVGIKEGVPILRMRPAVAEPLMYEGSSLARSVRIRVLSRAARPEAMVELYRDVCARENLPVHESSPGSISWDFDRMHLVVDVGPREVISPTRLESFTAYPQVRRFSFPMPSVVEMMLSALIGRGQKKNQMFATLLSDLGRATPMSPESVVRACVLWHLCGRRTDATVGRSEEVSEIINTFLLKPLEKEPITVSRNEPVWRDASKVSRRFDLAKYLLQETKERDNLFKKRLSTAP